MTTPKRIVAWILTLAASGVLGTIGLFALDAYIADAVAETYRLQPVPASITAMEKELVLVKGELVLIKDGLGDLTKQTNELNHTMQHFETSFRDYLQERALHSQ